MLFRSVSGASSDAVLAMTELLQPGPMTARSVLIVRGVGGLETLAEGLRARGFHVEYFEAYERFRPPTDMAELTAMLRAAPRVVLLLTSGEALTNLRVLAGVDNWRWLQQAAEIAAFSERLVSVARGYGFKGPHSIVPTSHGALVNALAELALRGERTTARYPWASGDTGEG